MFLLKMYSCLFNSNLKGEILFDLKRDSNYRDSTAVFLYNNIFWVVLRPTFFLKNEKVIIWDE